MQLRRMKCVDASPPPPLPHTQMYDGVRVHAHPSAVTVTSRSCNIDRLSFTSAWSKCVCVCVCGGGGVSVSKRQLWHCANPICGDCWASHIKHENGWGRGRGGGGGLFNTFSDAVPGVVMNSVKYRTNLWGS
jgi:hypothetical protein